MAHESRGDFSELALVIALERLGYSYDENLFLRSTPSSLKVCQSDVTVGEDKENPEIVFQVCSSGYEGGYQKKFWRDLGELIEIRRVFPETRVISVLFEPGAKKKLSDIYDFVSDSAIKVAELQDGTKLLQLIGELSKKSSVSKIEKKLAAARKNMPANLVAHFSEALKTSFERPKKVWRLNHKVSPVIKVEKLNYRRGILIGALFTAGQTDVDIQRVLKAIAEGKRLPPLEYLESLASLGLCKKVLGGSFVNVDENLKRCINRLGIREFIDISSVSLSDNKSSRVFDYIETIRCLSSLLPVWFSAILANFDDFCNEAKLAKILEENYLDHSLLLPEGSLMPNEPWVFRRLLDVYRAEKRKHFAIGIPRFDPVFKQNGLPALRFIISDYIAGRRPLSQAEARVAASVLAPELRSIKANVAQDLYDEFCDKVRRSEFKQRLITYRGFDPLPVILNRRFGSNATTILPKVVDYLGISGAATSSCVIDNDEISMWQSASKDGVAHKVKENVGRMGLSCLEVTKQDGQYSFSFSDAWQHRIIYIDGDWGEREICALFAGCFTDVRAIL